MKPATFLAFLLLLCAMAAVPAQAQTVINPRTVEFDPSADHNAVTTGGQAVVQRYDLQIYTLSATTPYTTGNLGKPAPQSDGKIRVDFSTLVTPWPLPDGTYDARVVAVGPTGTAPSDVSNTFAFQSQGCTYTLGSTSQAFSSGGGTGSVTVTAGTNCAWTAASDSTWVVLGTTTSGSGNGTVNFTVTSNLGATARSATLTIGGKTFLITQAAPISCSYSLSTNALSFTSVGGGGSVTVNTGGTCSWTSTGAPTWLHFSTSSGTGPGAATFNVDPNTGASTRTASLTIAGQAVGVTQTAPCAYSISPGSQGFAGSGGSASVAVTAGNGCSWTASSPVTWATLVGSSSGTGSGGVTVNVGANTSTTTRSTTVTIAGQPFAVTQSGLTCSYSISPASRSFTADGGSVSVLVTAGSGCSWTAASSDTWATLVGSNGGTGNGGVTVNVTANGTTAARSTTLTIAGQPFAVTESGITCSYSISPASQGFTEAGGAGSFTVSSPGACAWTATSSAATWLTVTSGANGSGDGTIAFSVAPNPLASSRTATITAGGQVFTVTQAAATVVCSYVLSGTGQNFTSAAGTGTVDVTAGAGCVWSAASNAGWLAVTSGASGSGGGTVAFSVGANPTTSPRSAALTVAGKLFAVTQDALSCSFSVTPASQTFAATAATASVTVGGPTACGWTATNGVSWVTLGATTGNGGASVPVAVAANPNATARSASLTIAGQPFTVTQLAGSCSYTLSPTASPQFGQGGGSGSFSVSCGSGCAWTASSAETWVTVTTTSGSGTGTVAFTVAKNTTTSSRTATITVQGQNYTVTQAAANRPSRPKKPRIIIGG